MSKYMELREAGHGIAKRYIEHRGMEVIEESFEGDGYSFDFIARDENGSIAFIKVKTYKSGACQEPVPETTRKVLRRMFEKAMIDYFTGHDCDSAPVRADVLAITIAGEHRAIVRHVCNVLAAA